MGTGGKTKLPMLVGQGTGGELEGTPGTGIYGKGDGVMIAGDVRTLMKKHCANGAKVKYTEYGGSHLTSALEWLPQAISWTFDRFGLLGPYTIPNNCSSIQPGNSLAPPVVVPYVRTEAYTVARPDQPTSARMQPRRRHLDHDLAMASSHCRAKRASARPGLEIGQPWRTRPTASAARKPTSRSADGRQLLASSL